MKSKTKAQKFHTTEEAPPKDIYNIDWNKIKKEKSEVKKAIQLFWWCSKTEKWGWFPFTKFIDLAKRKLHILIHSQTRKKPKEIVELVDDWMDQKGYDNVKDATMDSLPGDLYFRDYTLSKLWMKINNAKNSDLSEKIVAVDSAIHAEHATGDIWDGINIDALRENFEERYI